LNRFNYLLALSYPPTTMYRSTVAKLRKGRNAVEALNFLNFVFAVATQDGLARATLCR
jgi:hypothetical protein